MNGCPYWQEHRSVYGWVCFCRLAAFGERKKERELVEIGCTQSARARCYERMYAMMGIAEVPGPLDGERNRGS